ncbi:MAG: carboxypeptidase-like regulatory domain-containing protein [Cryomorphaceae bacterium]|nr:carboxypeptidase-like regulatory domain-containing protein [Cryomorphaceae bacterium]
MKHIFLLIFLIFGSASFSQTTIIGKVINAENQTVLPFTNVVVMGKNRGTVSDLEGNFQIHENLPTTLQVSYLGFYPQTIRVDTTFIVVQLQPQPEALEAVTVVPGVNPALRFIRGVLENKTNNDPEALPQYVCRSYNKLRLSPYFKNLDPEVDKLPKEVLTENFKSIKNMDFFVSESVSLRKYKKPGKVTEEVEATKTSGLKEPLFSVLAGQIQSFTFYEEEVEILSIRYLSPINRKLESHYRYLITDTMLVNDGKDTVFTIQFEPNSSKSIMGMKGQLQIQVPDYAIRSVTAEPTHYPSKGFTVHIRQLYEKIHDRTWFPVQLHADMQWMENPIDRGKADTAGQYRYQANLHGIIRSHLYDFDFQNEIPLRKVGGIVVRVADSAAIRDTNYWNEHRKTPLTNRDRQTYRVMDSLGEKYNFDLYGRVLQSLSEGYIRFPYVHLDLTQTMKINQYERTRLGAGFRTHDQFSRYWRLSAFAGYGFGDKAWKYGFGSDVYLHKASRLKVGARYALDLQESGGDRFQLDTRQTIFVNNFDYRRFYISLFDQLNTVVGHIEWHPKPTFKNIISLQYEERTVLGDFYRFGYPGSGLRANGQPFTYTTLSYEGRYAPKEKLIEINGRRQTIDPVFPILRYRVEQSISAWSPDPGQFFRAEVQFDHEHRGFGWGILSYRIKGGWTEGLMPYSYYFTPGANAFPRDGWFNYALLGDPFSWETLGFNEILFQQYFSTVVRWNLEKLPFRRNRHFPDFALVGKAMMGQPTNYTRHFGLSIETPKGPLLESGVELLDIYNNFGLGFYYRIDDNIGNPFDVRYVIKLRIQ